MTLYERLVELALKHGGLRGTARALKIDHGYLSRLASGEKRNPSASVLRKLGIKRVVDYVKGKP